MKARAHYWQAFGDNRGRELNGARHDYKLTFAANQIPDAERFWSLTMYTPNTVELVPNSANKYLVARYTPGPGVQRGRLGHLYGPTGNTAPDAGYNPPAITIAG